MHQLHVPPVELRHGVEGAASPLDRVAHDQGDLAIVAVAQLGMFFEDSRRETLVVARRDGSRRCPLVSRKIIVIVQ